MITTADLKSHTKSDLVKMAKRLGITGCGAMLKDDLAAAVAKATRSKAKASQSKAKGTKSKKSTKPASGKNGRSAKTPARAKAAGTRTTGTRKKVAPKTAAKRNGAVKTSTRKAVKNSPPKKKVAAKASPATKKTSAKKPVKRAATTKVAPKKLVVKKKAAPKPKRKPTNPRILKKIRELQLQKDSNKDISFKPTLIRPPGATEPVWEKEPLKDRVVLFVRDPFWLQASWDITRQAIERAKAAMAEQWHAAKPVLRLLRLDDSGTTSTSETIERDIEIHGGIRNWYIEWVGEQANFRVMVGYVAPNGRFHAICESNSVTTPSASAADSVDEHWSDLGPESERIFALSGGYDNEKETGDLQEMLEDRLHRNLGAPALAQLGAGADSLFRRNNDFHFDMDIELVVYGSTVPDGYLTLNGEPVSLREDGTFVLRLPFPDRRQVFPAVACSRDGGQQRTIVVAVERNTKIMEPLEKEKDTGE